MIKRVSFGENADNGYASYDVFEDLLMKSHLVKSEEFSFEKEARLSLICFLEDMPKIKCLKYQSNNNNNTISGFLLSIPTKRLIKKIIIGPTSKKTIAEIEGMLKRNGFTGVIVEKSKSNLK